MCVHKSTCIAMYVYICTLSLYLFTSVYVKNNIVVHDTYIHHVFYISSRAKHIAPEFMFNLFFNHFNKFINSHCTYCMFLIKHALYSIPYTSKHSRGKTFVVFADFSKTRMFYH